MVSALLRALGSLLHPKMLALMILPLAVAIALWLGFAIAFWSEAVQWMDFQVRSIDGMQWMFTVWPLALIATHLAWIMVLLLSVPLVLAVAVVIVSVFAMPAMVGHVSRKDYPGLAMRRGGSVTGSTWNAVQAVVIFLILGAVSLPLWLLPLLWPVLPVVLLGYLNQRMFRYDALADHAGVDEIVELIRRHRLEFFGLGLVLAVLATVPFFGFFMPVYGGLVFIHFGLGRLQVLRSEPIEGGGRLP